MCCSCNVSEMRAETVSCAFSEASWRHATPVRDLLLTISSIVFELETCVKKRKSSIFHALSLCGPTFLCRMNISHRYLAKTAFFANINTTTEPLPSPFFHPSNFCLFFFTFSESIRKSIIFKSHRNEISWEMHISAEISRRCVRRSEFFFENSTSKHHQIDKYWATKYYNLSKNMPRRFSSKKY